MRLHGSVRNLLKDQKIANLLITQSAPSQRILRTSATQNQKSLAENEENRVREVQDSISRRSNRLAKKPKLDVSEEDEDTQDEAPSLLVHLYKSSRENTPQNKPTIICPSPSKPEKCFTTQIVKSEPPPEGYIPFSPNR